MKKMLTLTLPNNWIQAFVIGKIHALKKYGHFALNIGEDQVLKYFCLFSIVMRSILTFLVLLVLFLMSYYIVQRHPLVNILYLAYP